MIELKKTEVAYVAIILIGLGASIYFLAPALGKIQNPQGTGTVITTTNEYPPVDLIVLTSTECKALCYTGKTVERLRGLLVNPQVRTVYLESAEGRQLADRYNLSLVPAYLMPRQQLIKSPVIAAISQYITSLGNDYFVLDTLETKSGFLFRNNHSASPSIDLYVASYDLNSLKAENITFTVLKRFNNSINLTRHHVVTMENGVFTAPSGEFELFEVALQTCMEQSGSRFGRDAILCRTREIMRCYEINAYSVGFCANNWKGCAATWNFTEEELTTCVRANNETILQGAYNESRGIGAVPTIVIDNRYRIVGKPTQIELLSDICAVYPSRACALN